jgi:hypothetical protein
VVFSCFSASTGLADHTGWRQKVLHDGATHSASCAGF